MTYKDFDVSVLKANKVRMINQIWKLIPMKEENQEWKEHLDVLIQELSGLVELFNTDLDFMILISKLEGLQSPVCEEKFSVYKKTVFRCVALVSRIFDNYIAAHE